MAPKVLLEFSLDVLVWEWDLEHDFSPWKWYYLGGGLTYYHPISEKQFFDVGVRLGPQILDTAYYGSDTNFQMGFHAGLGFFIIENVALNVGLSYDRVFASEEYEKDVNVFRFRTRVSYFFQRKK